MSKPLIVIADTDERYLSTLEQKFAESLDEKIELEIISDLKYFTDFFSFSKTAEIVVVSESLFSRELLKHNIANLFVLTEEMETGKTEELSIHFVYKYTTIKEIFNELVYRSREVLFHGEEVNKETTVISLYSAIGGSGKSCLSLGMAACLAQNHQRVLYISTESIQTFAYYLNNKNGMQSNGYRAMKDDTTHVYHNLRPFLCREGFTYVPPFMATLDALNLSDEVFVNLVKNAKESKDFDYIIVDIESGYSRMRTELLQISNKVLMVMLQDRESLFKTEYLLRNIDVHDREKYLFICNKYEEEKENAYISSELQKRFPFAEYIEYVNEPIDNINKLAQLRGIQKLAYMFI